jgi:hypothetical protein
MSYWKCFCGTKLQKRVLIIAKKIDLFVFAKKNVLSLQAETIVND